MSHIEKRAITIANFQPQYVKEAIELMANHHDFSILKDKNTVKAMDSRTSAADIVVQSNKDRYAIGINYTKGKIEMVGEFYNNKDAYNKVDGWVKAYYSAVVYGHSMVDSGEYQEFEYSWNENAKEVEVTGIAY